MPDVPPDFWLEKELTRQMAPVRAPDSLWDRVNRPQRTARNRVALEWLFWPVAAVMLLLAIAGVLRSSIAEESLASLPASPTRLEFRSHDLQAARAWVKANADIDIDVPAVEGTTERNGVQILCARIVQFHGLPVAAIDCRIGNQIATLFVSGKHAGLDVRGKVSKHAFARAQGARHEQVLSWNMRNQTYAIAFSESESPRAACLLCHANTPGLALVALPPG